MTPTTRAFLQSLRALGKSQVDRPELFTALHAHFPAQASGPEARRLLSEQLKQLHDAQELTYPQGKAHWDHTGKPELPNWIRLKRVEKEAPAARTHHTLPWAPELAFVAEMPRVDDLELLLRLQRFFAEGGRSRPMVPLRERSVQLFQDEKRLEQLVRTTLFEPGRLSLELLRCFPVASPLVWEEGPKEARGRPLLVIENHHTWDSFRRWNRERGVYSGVVYGAGNAFASSVEFLLEVRKVTGAVELHYFGDVDPAGLKIVARAQERLKASGEEGFWTIQPAHRWYERLLERAEEVFDWRLLDSLGENQVTMDEDVQSLDEVSWLPRALQPAVRALFAQGRRLPQELVGWEELLGMP